MTLADREYYRLLLLLSMRALMATPKLSAVVISAMIANCFLWWYIWLLLFHTAGTIKGWNEDDWGLFMGVISTGWGAISFICPGTSRIAQIIMDGRLDIYLPRPRNPLPQLIIAEADASWLGLTVSGLIALGCFANLDCVGVLYALAASVLVGLLYHAITLALQCLAFRLRHGSRLAEQGALLFDSLSSIPQHAQILAIRVVLLTAIPAGLIAILPVRIVRHHDPLLLLSMAVGVMFYGSLALWVFQRGLRRYTSATGWSA